MALLAVFDSTFFYGAKVNWMGMETIHILYGMRIVLKMSSNEDDGADLVVYSTSILFTMTPAHVSYSFTTFSDRFGPFGWLVGWLAALPKLCISFYVDTRNMNFMTTNTSHQAH